MIWALLSLVALAFAIGIVCGGQLLASAIVRSFDAPPRSDL